MRSRFLIFVFCIFCVPNVGCVSIVTRALGPLLSDTSKPPPVYPGLTLGPAVAVNNDSALAWVVFVVDFPFSFLLDTVLLPIDLISRSVYSSEKQTAEEEHSTAQQEVAKAKDQRALADLAIGATNEQSRWHALDRITDASQLARVATSGKYAPERGLAVRKLTDREILGSIAKSDADAGVRRAASERLRQLPPETSPRASREPNLGTPIS